MTTRTLDAPPDLDRRDETAWLDEMAGLARAGRAQDLDLPGLAEYLSDMAARDRREVESRLVVLLTHLLKWGGQPGRRSRGWRATVVEQRQELARLAASGTLRNHTEAVLAVVYAEALERAAAESGLSADHFPSACPYKVAELLVIDLPAFDA